LNKRGIRTARGKEWTHVQVGQFPMPADASRSATGITKGSGHIDSPTRPQLHTTPVVNPAALNRSAINGTTLIRPGFRPSGIGGPAKAGAINGTAIRLKR